MKILLSPSKQMNLENLVARENDINSKYFASKLDILKIENVNVLSKKAIELYSGIAFRQLTNHEDDFYKDVIILSSLYGYSYGADYISEYRLDYTTKQGRLFRKEMYDEINDTLAKEEVVYNLASKEFSKGIIHDNIIEFEFLVNDKNISATSKKMRGAMVEYIRLNGTTKLNEFSVDDFKYCMNESTSKKFVFKKSK